MPDRIKIFSPGRINIIGEHIDYNDGFVLPAAINLGLTITAQPINKKIIQATSDLVDNTAEVEFSLDKPYKGWLLFLYGVGHELLKLGYHIDGLNLDIKSTLPLGSGLSSSSALILGVLKAFDILYNLNISRDKGIEIARTVEHEYIGVMGGIMDQYSITYGQANHLVLIDCKEIKHNYIPFDSHGHQLVLFNSNVEHNLASSEYNTRRQECRQILELLEETSFRDLQMEHYGLYTSRLDHAVLSKRLKHILTEFRRVNTVVDELKRNSGIEQLKKSLYECHQSLSNDYEVSCAETDFIVNYLYQNNIYSRMMGGGFGGSILSIIPEGTDRKLIEAMKKEYYAEFELELTELPITIGNGVSQLS